MNISVRDDEYVLRVLLPIAAPLEGLQSIVCYRSIRAKSFRNF